MLAPFARSAGAWKNTVVIAPKVPVSPVSSVSSVSPLSPLSPFAPCGSWPAAASPRRRSCRRGDEQGDDGHHVRERQTSLPPATLAPLREARNRLVTRRSHAGRGGGRPHSGPPRRR